VPASAKPNFCGSEVAIEGLLMTKIRPVRRHVMVTLLLCPLAVGCGETQVDTMPAVPPATVTVTAEPEPEAEPEPLPEPAPDPKSKPKRVRTDRGQVGGGESVGGDTFVMPDERGKTLQAAQDDLQAVSGNPFFYSGSEDATGQDRGQWMDSGWQVCDQYPEPGTRVRDDEDDVMFYVVRISEPCP